MSDAKQIVEQQAQLETQRATWDAHCQEVGRYVLQRQQDFYVKKAMEGEKRNQYEFDSSANIALGRFAAAVDSLITPRSSKWHRLQHPNPDLAKVQSVRQYYDDLTDMLFRVRYSTRSNFAPQQQENYMALGSWGMAAKIITDDLKNSAIRYKACHMAEIYVMENQHGFIDTVYRKHEMTAKQAVQEFGEERLSQSILDKAERAPSEKFWFVHCVRPNPKYVAGSLNPDEMRFESKHVEMDACNVVREGGFRTMPYTVSRYVTAPNEVYGRSVAMMALADIKTLNSMAKTVLRAGQLAVEPPLLLHDDGILSKFQVKPNALNYGGVDDQGRQLVHPLQTGARLDYAEGLMSQRREAINDAFFVTLFQILVDAPQMTATEVLQRAQEKGVLLGPVMARQEAEDLGPMIERELDILSAAGQLPEMPPELIEAGGLDYEVYYSSPLARAQRAEETLGMQRTVEQAVALAGVDPAPLKRIDLDFYIREFGEANGAPADLFKDDETMEEEMAAEQQAAQMQQMAEMAPNVAGSIKDIAQAQAMGMA